MIMRESRDLLISFKEAEKRCYRLDESSRHRQRIVWRGREYDVRWYLRFDYHACRFEIDVCVYRTVDRSMGYRLGSEEDELATLIGINLAKLGDDDEWPTELPAGWLEDGRSDVHEDEA